MGNRRRRRIGGGGGWWSSPYAGAAMAADFSGDQYMVNGVNKTAITDLFAITRTTTGLARDDAGVVSSFGSGVIRRTDKGVLTELASTNQNIRSEEFQNATWFDGNCDALDNTAVAPNGTTTAATVTAQNEDTVKILSDAPIAIAADAIAAYSFFLKAGTHEKVCLTRQRGATNWISVVFDISAGTIHQSEAGAGATLVSSHIEPYTNGWFRCTVVGSVGGAQAFNVVMFVDALTGNTFTSTGEVASDMDGTETYFVWGAQSELDHVSSYIPTAAVVVTRNSDAITDVASGLETWFNDDSTPFTMYAEYDLDAALTAVDQAYWGINSDGNNTFIDQIGSGVNFQSLVIDGSSTLFDSDAGAPILGRHKSVSALAIDNCAHYVDGELIDAIDTDVATFPTSNTEFAVGNDITGGTAYLEGYTRKLVYFPARKLAADASALSLLAPSWALRSGGTTGRSPVWEAHYKTNQYYVENVEYSTIATFFTALGATFTRAAGTGGTSNASFVGSNGLIQVENTNDVPRLTYSPGANPVALGFLSEEPATNLQIKSEEFDDPAWAQANVVVTANDAEAPDGTTTADLITSKSETSVQTLQDIVATDTDKNYAYSVYVKPGTHNFIYINASDRGTSEHHVTGVYDLSASVPATATQTHVGTGSGTINLTRIEDGGFGWFRIQIAGKQDNANTGFAIGFANAATGNVFTADGDISFVGTGAETFHLWGGMAENPLDGFGANFATSYIKTTTVTVERKGDHCEITKTNNGLVEPFVGWNPLAGTMYTEFRPGALDASRVWWIIHDAGADSNEAYLFITGADARIQMQTIVGGSSVNVAVASAAVTGVNVKAAVSWLANDVNLSVDGGAVDNEGTVPLPLVTRMHLGGRWDDNEQPYGPIGRMAYFDIQLSDAELQAISTL